MSSASWPRGICEKKKKHQAGRTSARRPKHYCSIHLSLDYHRTALAYLQASQAGRGEKNVHGQGRQAVLRKVQHGEVGQDVEDVHRENANLLAAHVAAEHTVDDKVKPDAVYMHHQGEIPSGRPASSWIPLATYSLVRLLQSELKLS